MIKEIKYNGYTANISDYECADGDLATSMGLVQDDGTMKPVLPPSLAMQLDEGSRVIGIHETSLFKNYIIYNLDLNKIIAVDFDSKKSVEVVTLGQGESCNSVSFIGNTMILHFVDSPIKYALWKDFKYRILSSRPPFIPIKFGLYGASRIGTFASSEFKFYWFANASSSSVEDSTLVPFNKIPEDISREHITSEVLASVNKFIVDNTTNIENSEYGAFIFPFFVRYAIRLYDGTLVMHSAPVLMIPNSTISLVLTKLIVSNAVTEFTVGESHGKIEAFRASLYAMLDIPEGLNDWSDLISSVDIFISAPIYTYDQSGYIKGWTRKEHAMIRPQKNLHVVNTTFNGSSFSEVETFSIPDFQLLLPMKSDQLIADEIKSCAHFYKVKSINFDELDKYSTHMPLDIEAATLASLQTREVMTDDYNSHNDIIAESAYIYNNRVNLFNVTEIIKDKIPLDCRFTHLANPQNRCRCYTDFIINNVSYRLESSNGGNFNSLPRYLYFSHPGGKNIRFLKEDEESPSMWDMPLTEHPHLNGSCWFGGFGESTPVEAYSFLDCESEIKINYPNKIYTSEINNPFIFPLSGINTVSSGKICGLSSAAKALSEGQFGQFPLYAFTTEGVWALEVSSTGTYSAKQPITRDVVINPDSITQIDSAVLFATDRGIMHISGSTAQCISDTLNTEQVFNISDLPMYDKLLELFNSKADACEKITLGNITLLPFNEFLKGCRMIYDYTYQRIIVYNAAVSYAYVYSLKSRSWGMMRSDIVDNVNSYPEALAMAQGDKLVDFSKPQAENITALIVTRPFKIDDPNAFKTINTIIQRGQFRSTHVQQVLYGSNDLEHWHTVWSSVDKIMRGFRGTPYKAYRLALICKFDKGESIYGCTVVYETRMTNQVR